MRTPPRLASLAAGLALLPLAALADGHEGQSKEWPFPEDIPTPQPADPGLAGSTPPNIVRFLKVRSAGAADLSPDGQTIAFRQSVTGVPQVWTVPATGGWPSQLTFGGAVSNHSWLPTGDGLLYGADREGDERLGLKIIAPDGTSERIARPYSRAFVAPGDYSSDGRYLAYATTQRTGSDYDIHVLDLETGADRRVFEGRFGFFVAGWRPGTSDIVLRETRGEDGNNLHLLNVDTGLLTPLFVPDEPNAYSDITWLPNGSGFYLTTNQGRDFSALAFYDMGEGTLETVAAPENADVESVTLAGAGRYLIWTVNDGGFSLLKGLDRSTGKTLPRPEGLAPGIYSLDGAEDAPVVAITVRGPATPGEIRTWNIETNRLVLAAPSELAGLDPSAFVTPESLFFKASDGVRLNGLFYKPQGAGDTPPPVVVMVHGGPTAQARPGFRAVTQYLLAQGIAVFDLNFRGSTGFGKRFANLDNQFNRTDSVRDVADAIDWLGTTGRVNAKKAAVMGGSYGGYLTNAVVGMYPDKFVAGVSFVGVSDWVRALETASPALKASDRIEYGDITDPKVREYHASISPINFVDKITASLMVLHGANDPRDPIEESDALVKAIRARGGEVTYLRFPDEGHGIRKIENRITAYRRIAAFLKEELQ